jgi:hypothetical protein
MKIKVLVLVAIFALMFSCSKDNPKQEENLNYDVQTNSTEFNPEKTYATVMKSYYGASSYQVSDLIETNDKSGKSYLVKKITNTNGVQTGYLIKKSRSNDWIFADRNEETDIVYFNDLDEGQEIKADFESGAILESQGFGPFLAS